MRHRVGQRKLGRVTEHRIAMLRNQAEALITHEHIETTLPKAKELRPFVERIITIAKRGIAAGDTNQGALHARRMVLRDIQNRDVVSKLFDTIAPRFAARPGGYTRILRVGYRRGDSAEVAQIELVGSEYRSQRRGQGDRGQGGAEAEGRGRPPARGGGTPARQGQAGRRRGRRRRRRRPEEEGQARAHVMARAARQTPGAKAPRRPRRGKRAARSQATQLAATSYKAKSRVASRLGSFSLYWLQSAC